MSAERRPPTAEAVLETIRSRRVTRDFDERPVAVEAILDVLEAGRWATSGGNRRIHRFLVVRGRSTLARLRAIAPGMLGAPAVVIVICTDAARAAEELVQLEHDATTLIDVGTAAMNMMVAAHALGLGTCPVTSFSHVAARVVLDLPPTAEPELLLLLGHPERPPVATSPTVVRRQRSVTFPASLISWERLGWEAPEPPTEPGTRGVPPSGMATRPTPVRDTISSSAGSPTDAPKEDHHT